MERSKKVVFVSHCLLNQNSRPVGTERYSGCVKELTDLFAEAGIGIIQIPCPQVEFNGGIHRKLRKKDNYDTKKYRKNCKTLSKTILDQIESYRKKDYEVLGILGVEFSSTCGVHQVVNGNKNSPGRGIFIEELEDEMDKKKFQIPILGVNLNNIFTSMKKIQMLLNYM